MKIRALLICLLVAVASVNAVAVNQPSITWYGQSFFIVTSSTGGKITFDPYHIQDGIKYSPPSVSADLVLISHNHFDHNNADLLTGKHTVIKPLTKGTESGTLTIGLPDRQVKKRRIQQIPYKFGFSSHDASGGKERGGNTIRKISVDGVSIVHLGDLGIPLTKQQIKQIGPVDILLVPVGGKYTIDAAGATKVIEQLKPKVAIPMHYKTPKITIPLVGVEPFVKGKKNIVEKGDTYSFTANSLPSKTTIMVLKFKERPKS